MKRAWPIGLSGLALVVGVYAYVRANSGPLLEGSGRALCIGGRCCCLRKPGVAPPARDAGTLDPDLFIGEVKRAYKFAGQKPALLAQLWCYCGCDSTDGHRSLLDCYRDNHGSRCAICTGEALMAQQMSEQESPVDQIREAIRKRYEGAE